MFTKKLSTIAENIDLFRNKQIVVEGIKDRQILTTLGMNNIFSISGRPLDQFITLFQPEEDVLILTDFDQEGEEKASLLTKLLEGNGVGVNSFLRSKFKTLFECHKIEEIKSITKFMEDDYNGEISPINYKIFNRSRIHSRRAGRKTRRYWRNIRAD